MKNIIRLTLITLITLFSVNSFSQGNLQFNRARMESYSKSSINRNFIYYDTLVVPAGKALKITSAKLVYQNSIPSYPNLYYSNNSNSVHLYIGDFRLESSENQSAVYSIWLSEGKHVLRFIGASSNSQNAIFSYTGIEFNVIP